MIISIENQLLHAALLCGMKPNQKPAHRFQLFLVANKHLKSKSHQNDFQRELETSVDRKGLWDNYGKKGSGHYVITLKGHQTATHEIGIVEPIYQPLTAEHFRCKLSGKVQGKTIQIHIKATRATILINGRKFPTAEAACKFLEENTNLSLPRRNESAARVLYNLAIDYSFDIDLL